MATQYKQPDCNYPKVLAFGESQWPVLSLLKASWRPCCMWTQVLGHMAVTCKFGETGGHAIDGVEDKVSLPGPVHQKVNTGQPHSPPLSFVCFGVFFKHD